MILAACVTTRQDGKGKVYVGAAHLRAAMDAGLYSKRDKLWKGFISDTAPYVTTFRDEKETFQGHIRFRDEAWIEAVECKQIGRDDFGEDRYVNGDDEAGNPIYIGFLDSSMIKFSPDQLAKAQQIADGINAAVTSTRLGTEKEDS